CRYPLSAKLFRYGRGRTRAAEKISNEVARVRGGPNDSFQQCLRLLGGILDIFVCRGLLLERFDISPYVSVRLPFGLDFIEIALQPVSNHIFAPIRIDTFEGIQVFLCVRLHDFIEYWAA